MGCVGGLHHLNQRCAFALVNPETPPRCLDIGCVVADRLQQPQHTVAFLGGSNQHRCHLAVAQVGGEIVEYSVARWLDLFEQLFHQLVIVIGERFQHGKTRLDFARLLVAGNFGDFAFGIFAIDVGAFQSQVDRADDDAVLAQGNLAQQQWDRACRL
jgi:hypothetical protein